MGGLNKRQSSVIMIQSGGGLRYQLRARSSCRFSSPSGRRSDPSSLLSISLLSSHPLFLSPSFILLICPPLDRFIELARVSRRPTSVKIERGACHTHTRTHTSRRSHARSNRAKEPTTANQQRGKHHEIDSVVATTF